MTSSTRKLDVLFPVPGPPPSPLSPARLSGVTYESGIALSEVLKENHEKWHIFFNEKGFHNHTSHHLLAVYYLGAKGTLLRAAYESDIAIQRPARKSPGSINEKNFHEHLGDENYWKAYLEFFSEVLLEKGTAATIEKYIFSPQANVEEPAPGKQPMQMQSRFLAGLLHPLIHTGYGTEFALLGMVAEGLAQTAVHKPEAPALVPDSLFQYVAAASVDATHATVSYITSLLPSLSLEKVQRKAAQTATGVHALTIVARILHDDRFSSKSIGLPIPNDEGGEEALNKVVKAVGDVLVSWADAWTVDGTSAEEVESKIEELIWTNVVLYGVGGWSGRNRSKTGKFNADFPLMHLVTSVTFLHSLVAYLSPTSTSILLRSYFINCLAWWISRGKPSLPIENFYASVTATPAEHGAPHVLPAEGVLVKEDVSPNPFLPILQTTLMHPDDHLPKCQRALAHFAALFGARPKGTLRALSAVSDPKARLPGAEHLDGTLFIRVAGLTADRLGWMREGQENLGWDFDGFFDS
ncbi:hypothetical protein OBBRIDRAFT_798236 [Obba rivulosa]|uniref:Uncharacterized protein n=1 Tax=Obba rivulosa TaxID=1052685 RepID=A0A8E2AJJ9_9APHY|nr:hypothetical protein OBBRIDRAFT_798236 [Obba rivulosa]